MSSRTRMAVFLGLALLALHAVLTWRLGVSAPQQELLRVADGRTLTLAAALPDLAAGRLVFLGEFHDQPSHHAAQLATISALHEAGHPLAVGLEMFRANDQLALDGWVAGTLPLEDFLPIYYANWDFPWALYRDLFTYAREHGIPLVGLNLPRPIVQQVARNGFASLGFDQLQQLPPVQCIVDAEYETFIRRSLGMHGPGGLAFTRFCEAQLLWDAVMALNLLTYLEAHPTTTVAVLAGRGHAWKRGIPAQVAQRAPVPMRILAPKLPDNYHEVELRPEDTDYFWLGLELR